MEQEKKEILSPAALLPPEENAINSSRQAAVEDEDKGENAAKPLTFRGQPIAWVTVPQKKAVIHKSAFDEETKEVTEGIRHLIDYQNRQQTRGEFLAAAFPDYRKYPYKVHFKNDNVYRLSGN